MIVRIATPPGHGPRFYIGGMRIHHGATGLAMLVAGACMIAHDWRDRPWPFRDIPSVNNPFDEGKSRAASGRYGGH